MKRIHPLSGVFLSFLIFASASFSFSIEQTELPKTDLPVLITSCGQSPGPVRLKAIFKKLDLEYEPKAYDVVEFLTAKDLKIYKDVGTPFKTLIIVMGASLKGMGAAGISIEDEIDRVSELMKEARQHGMTIIGAHIGGMKRRAQGAMVGDNTDELSIDAVAPKSDLLVVIKEGNADGRFTIISQDKGIPMIEAEKLLDLIPEFEKLFKK